jgi:hypothetical protein
MPAPLAFFKEPNLSSRSSSATDPNLSPEQGEVRRQVHELLTNKG